ncbi:MAG TPA: XrtA/PEP-CTERM system-associated ATPase [Burkholderiaceae bacterium]
MYETHYGLTAKPFQLRPDPNFFYGSKGHKRAMAYLDYGVSQGEGFIVITGEVGAGKTTLVRNLFRKIESDKIYAVQIVNTHLDSDDILRMVASGFELPYAGVGKAELLTSIEELLRYIDKQGKRALLVVDEAQNLTPRAVEELRMLSNFQTAEKSLLQTFLLGQPEFRKTLMSPGMQQLRQRVIATYHLGPMDVPETRTYIEHRLATVGWNGNPSFDAEAFDAIHRHTGGIPRRINALCDRLFLMGYLEELTHFTEADVETVAGDIAQEFTSGETEHEPEMAPMTQTMHASYDNISIEHMDARISGLERSVMSMLDAMKAMLGTRRQGGSEKQL